MSVPLVALSVYHDEVSTPRSESCVAFWGAVVEETTFQDEMGICGSANVVVVAQMVNVRISHPARDIVDCKRAFDIVS